MIRLQASREPSSESDRIAKTGHDAALAGDENKILIAHQLANGGDDFGRQARRELAQYLTGRFVAQQPVTKSADRHFRNRLEGGLMVSVDNEPSYVIVLVRDDRFVDEATKWEISKGELCCYSLFVVLRHNTRERVTTAGWRRLCQKLFEAVEAVGFFRECRPKLGHRIFDPAFRHDKEVGGLTRQSGTKIIAESTIPANEIAKNGVQLLASVMIPGK